MTENNSHGEHEEISLLLPWFVNKTLDETESDLVRRHIDTCEECRDDVSLLSSVQSSMSRNSLAPILTSPDSATLLESVDAHESALVSKPKSRRRTALIASLAAGLAAAALVFILQNPTGDPNTRFDTATSRDEVAAMDYVIDISFAEDAGQADLDRVLLDIGAKDILANQDAGTYRVTINLRVNNLEDLERYTGRLESMPLVKSVEVVAMQLPVTSP